MPYRHGQRIRALELIDIQAGGDVSRIILAGVGDLPGDSVLAKARYLENHGDGLRRLLLSEPYGDPAMSVNLVLEPSREEAEAGYIIMEAMGYPLYSGSNTICTATAVLQSGFVPMGEQDGTRTLILESPAGLARITAECRDGWVTSITTQGEPAYVAVRDRTVDIPGHGSVHYDLVWSGAFYALVDAPKLGFDLVREEEPALAAFGDVFMRSVRPDFDLEHPLLGAVGTLPFVHFAGPLERDEDGFRSRSATYVHPGVICRSPTGTGTSARLARMWERGDIGEGQWLDTISPRGTSFRGTVMGPATVGDYHALDSHITGRAWTLSHTQIMIDLDDPMVDATDLEHLLP